MATEECLCVRFFSLDSIHSFVAAKGFSFPSSKLIDLQYNTDFKIETARKKRKSNMFHP